jgi:hypothetical protein
VLQTHTGSSNQSRVRWNILERDLVFLLTIEDLMIVNSKLNDFLFEHEMLDDRERDRDFFVAVRALSLSLSLSRARVIELQAAKWPVKVSYVGAGLLPFLDTRNERYF